MMAVAGRTPARAGKAVTRLRVMEHPGVAGIDFRSYRAHGCPSFHGTRISLSLTSLRFCAIVSAQEGI